MVGFSMRESERRTTLNHAGKWSKEDDSLIGGLQTSAKSGLDLPISAGRSRPAVRFLSLDGFGG